MKKMAKRALAFALTFALVLGIAPANVQAAVDATVSVTMYSDVKIQAGEAVTDKEVGFYDLRGADVASFTDDFKFKFYNGASYVYYSQETTPTGLTLKASNNKIFATTTTSVKPGTYYFEMYKVLSDNSAILTTSTTSRLSITIGENLTTRISSVSVSVPTTLSVGESLEKNLEKVTYTSNDQYEWASSYPLVMYPYTTYYEERFNSANNAPLNDSAGNDTVINKDRRYYLTVRFAAKKDCYFPESTAENTLTRPIKSLQGLKQYGGTLSSSASVVSSAVSSDGKILTLIFEYYVDGNGQTVVANNGNIQPTQGLVSVWGNTTANVAITAVGTTATVADISQDVVNNITSGTNQSNIVMDLSTLNSSVTTGTITYNTMTRFVNAINSTTNGMKALEMRLPKATAVLDAASLNSIVSQAGNTGDLSITLNEITTDNLTSTQRAGLTGNTIVKVIRATTRVGTKDITSFGAGYETISLPYTLTTGQSADKIYVAHIAANGTLTKVSSSYANNRVTFTTNHNSDFVVIHEKTDVTADLYPVYRAYNPNSGDHLLTLDQNEYNVVVRAGWSAEGEVFKVSKTQGDSIYRIYNPNTGEHFYTKSLEEKNTAVKAGWKDESSAFRSYGNVPVYRLYNPNQIANNHLFTTSLSERNNLLNLGWKEGSIVFYVNAK